MSSMKQVSVSVAVVMLSLLVGAGASAQVLFPPGSSQFNPPPPPPPPPPKIEVPKIPQFGAAPTYDYKPPARPSFGDRVTKCLDDAAAAGLGPADRATYSRSCANQ
jgi:hypothetical protein